MAIFVSGLGSLSGTLDKYRALPKDSRRKAPFVEWDGLLAESDVGPYWTVPVAVPLSDLADVETEAQNPEELRSIKAAFSEGKILPPIQVTVYPNGSNYLIDGNHRLTAARRLRLPTILTVFTFPRQR